MTADSTAVKEEPKVTVWIPGASGVSGRFGIVHVVDVLALWSFFLATLTANHRAEDWCDRGIPELAPPPQFKAAFQAQPEQFFFRELFGGFFWFTFSTIFSAGPNIILIGWWSRFRLSVIYSKVSSFCTCWGKSPLVSNTDWPVLCAIGERGGWAIPPIYIVAWHASWESVNRPILCTGCCFAL